VLSGFKLDEVTGKTYDGQASSILPSKLTSRETLYFSCRTWPKERGSSSLSALRTLGPFLPDPVELVILVACFSCVLPKGWVSKGEKRVASPLFKRRTFVLFAFDLSFRIVDNCLEGVCV